MWRSKDLPRVSEICAPASGDNEGQEITSTLERAILEEIRKQKDFLLITSIYPEGHLYI